MACVVSLFVPQVFIVPKVGSASWPFLGISTYKEVLQ